MVFDYTCKSNLDFLQNLRKQSNLPALTHENAKYKKKQNVQSSNQSLVIMDSMTFWHNLLHSP